MATTDIKPGKLSDADKENPFIVGDPSQTIGDDEPKPRKTRSDAGRPRGPRKGRKTALAGKITQAANMVAAGLAAVDMFDSLIVSHNAENIGKSWAPVVEQNPRVKQFFESLEKGGVWGAAIISAASVALPIIAHHMPGALPAPVQAIAHGLIPEAMREQMQGMSDASRNPNNVG